MSVKAGDIVIELNLDNDGFTARVKDSGQVLRQLQGDFNRTATSVKRMEQQTDSISTRFRHLVMTLGNLRFVAMDINDVFLRLPAAILKTAGEMERLEKTMTGLSTKFTELERAAEGASNFKFVTDMAKRAPFEIGAIADAFIKFKTGGIDPTNGSLQALTDSVAKFGGNSESLKRASVAIQQMMGKGVVSMEELRQQLGEAVPTAMRDMADGMGVSMARLADMVKKGTLEAGPAIEKMLLQMKVNNAGAAEAMMETWVGSMARLKTEWALTSKFISEKSGFGEAAKSALDSISGAMASDEFKRFAISFGGTLKEAVEAFVTFSRVIVENRDALKLLIEGFVLYKVGTSIIYPALKSVEKGLNDQRNAIGENIAATRNKIVADREEAVAGAANSLYRTERRQAELAETLRLNQMELASVRARNAAIIAEDARMHAQLMAMKLAERNTGVNNIGAQQGTLRYMDELSRKNQELVTRERELATAVAQGTTAVNAATLAANAKTQALHNVSTGAMTASRSAVALGVAVRGLQGAFNLVGGWIGVATIALLAGIEIWNRYGRAAEENAARAKRAALGLSSASDLAEGEANLANLRRELSKAQEEQSKDVVSMPGRSGTAVRKKTAEEALAQAGKVRDLFNQVNASEREVTQARISVMEATGRDLATVSERLTEQRLRAISKQGDTERAAIDKKFADENQNTEKKGKAWEAKEREQTARRNAVYQATQAKKLAVLKEELAKEEKVYLGDGGTNEAKEAARLRREKLMMDVANLEGTIQRDINTRNKPIGILQDEGKGPKGPKDNPIQRLIKDLESDNAGLAVQVSSLGKTLGAAELVQAKFAEIDAKFKAGEYDGTGKNGVKATKPDVDRLKAAERTRIFNEQLIKDSQDFTQRMDGIGPRYQEALEIIADPLGERRKGSELRRVDDYFSKIAEDRLRAVAAIQGMDVEGLKTKMRGMAAAIDATPEFQRMEQETKQLNDAIVEDTREAAKARQLAADETYRNFHQNEIDKVRAAAGGNAEIVRMADTMQDQLSRNMDARARTAQEKFKSPIEKMADQWSNATRNMEEASVRWANGTIEAIGTTGKDAKKVWGDLVKGILSDLIKIQLQKQMAGLMKDATSGGPTGGGLLGSLGSMMGWSGSSGTPINPNVSGADLAMFYANGGIHSPRGSIPLKKYAAGGIANSPQMAIYGEGDMNEAYVPLPDGRRIPVAMQGAGGQMPSVTVNVINSSGQPVSAQQGQTRMDGRQVILDVVLSAAGTPGPFRDGMKNTLKS